MTEIVDAFYAFNVNGFSNLVYIMITNWWFLLIAIGAIASVVLYLHEEISVTVHDEQKVL